MSLSKQVSGKPSDAAKSRSSSISRAIQGMFGSSKHPAMDSARPPTTTSFSMSDIAAEIEKAKQRGDKASFQLPKRAHSVGASLSPPLNRSGPHSQPPFSRGRQLSQNQPTYDATSTTSSNALPQQCLAAAMLCCSNDAPVWTLLTGGLQPQL